MNNMKVFVTGANGFIGQNLVDFLASKGYEVYALIRPTSLPCFKFKDNIHIVYGDLRDINSLSNALPKDAYIVNLAAIPYHKTLSYDVNVLGTENLLKVASAKKCKKIIHISSQATKIKNKGVYANTKIQSDESVKRLNIPHVILKPSLVYGGGEKGLFVKISKLASKLPFIPVFGDGNTPLYPIHVKDLCSLIEKIMVDSKLTHDVFDVGGKEKITYNVLYQKIADNLPNHPTLLHIPVGIGLLVAKVISFLPNPPIYRDNILGSTQNTNCNSSPLLSRYKYTTQKFDESVQEIFSPKRIQIGIVGLGKMGMLHATILNSIPNAKITALIDTNPKLYTTFKTMGIKGHFYPSLTEALKSEHLDAIYITTPTFAHFEILKEAIKNNIHVFVEKPATLDIHQVHELQKLKPKQIIHVGYTLLYTRTYTELKRIIEEKRYGDILSFSAKFLHGEVMENKKGWMFTKKLSGGGVLMNPGPHLFSLLQYNFGKPSDIKASLKKIYSKDVEDEAKVVLSYGKFSGDVSLSWSQKNTPIAKYEISIVFSKAIVTINGQTITINTKGKKQIVNEYDLPPMLEEDIFNINPDAYGEAYFAENAAFLDAISSKKNVKNSLSFALESESTIFNIYSLCGESL